MAFTGTGVHVASLAAVAVGGATGAVLRYLVSLSLRHPVGGFPLATLLVNVTGSAIVGLFIVWANSQESEVVRALVQVGLLGSLTTFSTFSLETVVLLESGRYGMASANIAFNVVLCCAGCALGITMARSIW